MFAEYGKSGSNFKQNTFNNTLANTLAHSFYSQDMCGNSYLEGDYKIQ